MDLDEVKVLIRSLITSSQVSCTLRYLLRDYKNETGMDLPLFGYRTPIDFLRSIPDTIRLSGGSNPEIFLVESEKSAHVSSLVEGQRKNPKLGYIRNRVVLSKEREDKENCNASRTDKNPPPLMSLNVNPSEIPQTSMSSPFPSYLMSSNPPISKPNTSTQFNQSVYDVSKLAQEVQRNPPVILSQYNMYYNQLLARNAIMNNALAYAMIYNAQVQNSQYQSTQWNYPIYNNFGGVMNSYVYQRNFRSDNGSKTTKARQGREIKKTKESSKIENTSNNKQETGESNKIKGTENDKKEIKKTEESNRAEKTDNNSQALMKENVQSGSEVDMDKSVLISRFERDKLCKFLQQRPKGASMSEILGILTINPLSSKKFKKTLPSVSDIVSSCSHFSELRDDNRLYYKEPSDAGQEANKKPEVIPVGRPVTKKIQEETATPVKKLSVLPQKIEMLATSKNGRTRVVQEQRVSPKEKFDSEEKPKTIENEKPNVKESFEKNCDWISTNSKPQERSIKNKKDFETGDKGENQTGFFQDFDDLNHNEFSRNSEINKFSTNDMTTNSSERKDFQPPRTSPVNDRVQKKLIEVMKKFPDGLWCCELPEKYYEVHKSILDYRDFGYTSLIRMVIELPEIFRCCQPGLDDWILFDATGPTSEEEVTYRKMAQQSIKVPNCIKSDLLKLLESRDVGIYLNDITASYYKKYKRKLDFESLGFASIKELIEALDGELVRLTKLEKKILVMPLEKKAVTFLEDSGEMAVPPILPGDDLFIELFPEEVFGPNEKLSALRIEKYLEVGSIVEIVVGEVWTPHRFYVQLKEYQDDFNEMMTELQNFYDFNLNKYEMPAATLQPKQICAAYYNNVDVTEKWHRAEIIKKLNEDRISVNLVDFGTVTTLRKSHLRFLTRNFGELPIQATFCCLDNIEPPGGQKKWPNTTNEMFLKSVIADSMLLEVIDVDYEEPRLTVKLSEVMEDKTSIDIGDLLVKEGLAVYSNEVEMYLNVRSPLKKSVETTRETNGLKEERIPETKNKPMGCSVGVVSPILFESPSTSEPETNFKNSTSSMNIPPNSPVSPFGYQPEEEVFRYRREVKAAVSSISTSSKNPIGSRNISASSSYFTSESSFSTGANLNSSVPLSVPQPSPLSSGYSPVPPSSPAAPPLCAVSPTAGAAKNNVDMLSQYIQALQTQMELKQRQLALEMEEKKKINNLAIHFLKTNSDMSVVAQFDPQMAFRIATSMAEAFYNSTKSTSLLQTATANASSTITATATATASTARVHQVPSTSPDDNRARFYEKDVDVLTEKLLPLNITSPTSSEQEPFRRYVKEEQVKDRTLHVFNIDSQPYVCVDQLIRNYTAFSSRSAVDQLLLASKKPSYYYRTISRWEYGAVFEELESFNSFKWENTDEDSLCLLPLNKATLFLHSLQKVTRETLFAFTELVENFKPYDKYWIVP